MKSLAIAGIACMAAGCQFFGGDPVAPYEKVPIDLTKAHSVSTTFVQIKPDEEYDRFRMNLEFKAEKRKIDGVTVIDRQFLMSLRKYFGAPEFGGKGVMIPIRLTITKLEGKETILYHDKIYHTKGIRALREQSLIRQITIIHLFPGKYSIRLENLKAISDLPKVSVFLDVQTFFAK